MRQSRTMSVVEAIFSTAVGWSLALVTQMLVFPAVGLQVMLWQNLALSLVFSGVSIVRGYAVRRFFSRLAERP